VSIREAFEELLHIVAVALADRIAVVVAAFCVTLRAAFCRVEETAELFAARSGEVRGKLSRR
jgi:hypothetical protein